jgi:hypothetical protein
MWSTLTERMIKLAGSDGWLLLGGAPIAAREARAAFPVHDTARAYLLADLHVGASLPEIGHSAAAGANFLRRQEDLTSVRSIMELAGHHGRGVIGLTPTLHALDERRVARLYVSRGFVDGHPSEAERVARGAFDQRAIVEIVSGDGGSLLDLRADGVAAVLHYTVSEQGGKSAAVTDQATPVALALPIS